MRRLLLALAMAIAALPLTTAFAATNPNGTGQPSQTCQVINASSTDPSGATGPFYPGGSANAPGSVFAEPGGTFTNGGTGGLAYNNAGAPSQYDVACYQMSQKP